MPGGGAGGRTGARDEEFLAFAHGARSPLLRTAVMLTAGDHHLAEDLVQIALTKVYVAWPTVRDDDRRTAFARRVLVHAFVDQTRTAWWRRERGSGELPEIAVDPPSGVLERPGLEAALAQLPPRMRAVVVLRYWLDLDVAETAAHLGCSPGTVRGQSSRALAGLRRVLAAADPELGPVGRTNR